MKRYSTSQSEKSKLNHKEIVFCTGFDKNKCVNRMTVLNKYWQESDKYRTVLLLVDKIVQPFKKIHWNFKGKKQVTIEPGNSIYTYPGDMKRYAYKY